MKNCLLFFIKKEKYIFHFVVLREMVFELRERRLLKTCNCIHLHQNGKNPFYFVCCVSVHCKKVHKTLFCSQIVCDDLVLLQCRCMTANEQNVNTWSEREREEKSCRKRVLIHFNGTYYYASIKWRGNRNYYFIIVILMGTKETQKAKKNERKPIAATQGKKRMIYNNFILFFSFILSVYFLSFLFLLLFMLWQNTRHTINTQTAIIFLNQIFF